MSRRVAILCSGQGVQHAEMFDLVSECPASNPVFRAAAEELGSDPRDFVATAARDALFANVPGQILCCTQALATWTALRNTPFGEAVIAGYSVGELAAWGCAGAFDPTITLRLARRRASAMDAAAPWPGGLAAIIGLARIELEPILKRWDTTIAIINGADSFLIGGETGALESSCTEALQRGARRAVKLLVAVPSHTRWLASAAIAFRAALRELVPHPAQPTDRLLSGLDGSTVWEVDAGLDRLAAQICTPINWDACLKACRSAGADTALELGPGHALSHMATPLFPSGRARSTEDFRSLNGLLAWLADDLSPSVRAAGGSA
jgi:[acyl-carrier-protein] S-malonyltransferase